MSGDEINTLVRRFSLTDLRDPISTIELITPPNSGSGATFHLIRTMSGGTLMMKSGTRVEGDVHTYSKLGQHNLEEAFESPILKGASPTGAFHITPFLDVPDNYDFLANPANSDQYPAIFQKGIGRIITQFFADERPCEDPRTWFFQQTCNDAIAPLKKLMNANTAPALVSEPKFTVNGVAIPNGLAFLETLSETDPSPLIKRIQAMLFPRYLAETVSDPTPLNEMVKEDGPKFIDPGEIRRQQLSYLLCKHDGPFALVFPSFMKGNIAVTHNNTAITIAPVNSDTYMQLKKVHDIRTIMANLTSLPNGKEAMQRRPFAMLHLLFYSARQFFRDSQYSITQDKRDRTIVNLALGSLAMEAIRQVLERTALALPCHTKTSLQDVFKNPNNFDQLNAIATTCYTNFIQSNTPIATLFSEFFVKDIPIQSDLEKNTQF